MSQEIYVKEMPIRFEQISQVEDGNCENLVTLEFNVRDKFVVKSLHAHDKELVAKVLEKTKTFVRDNTYICGRDATREDIITSSAYNQALRDVLYFMETLQKEYEK